MRGRGFMSTIPMVVCTWCHFKWFNPADGVIKSRESEDMKDIKQRLAALRQRRGELPDGSPDPAFLGESKPDLREKATKLVNQLFDGDATFRPFGASTNPAPADPSGKLQGDSGP